MMAVLSKESVPSGLLTAFESLATQGKIRSDMTQPGHHDGWGLVSYFREGFPQYLAREPHSVLQDSEHLKKGADYLEKSQCKVALLHFRKITVGDPSISNTHPFLHQQWAFAHNGTLYHHEKIPLENLEPAGTTDSERLFLYLMETMAGLGKDSENEEKRLSALKESVEKVKRKVRYSSLTFLLTNGKSIYICRDSDAQYEDYYTLYTATIGNSTIIASEPLPKIGFGWELVPNGTILKVSN
ncbi:MAG: class II glutamine amidotransferase [Elusimicrobia bacterium]|nr:class II glutamine amidotransferase [Elusimicrobiota bacterium]